MEMQLLDAAPIMKCVGRTKLQTPDIGIFRSKLQTPNSKLQAPNSKLQIFTQSEKEKAIPIMKCVGRTKTSKVSLTFDRKLKNKNP